MSGFVWFFFACLYFMFLSYRKHRMNANGIIKWEETESYTDNKFVSKDANKKKKSGEKRTKK